MFLSLRSGLSVISRGIIAGAQQSYNRILKLFPTVSSLAPASTRPVQQGQVCEFDGVDDYVSLPSNAVMQDGESFTWVIRAEQTGGNDIELSRKLPYRLFIRQSYINNLRYYDGVTIHIFGSSSVLYDGSHHTLVITRTGTRYDAFIDQVFIGSITTAVGFIVNQIGHANFKGMIHSVTYDSYGQYNLNHASGTTAYDSSGNGNDGTLQNGAAFVVDNTLPPEADRLNLEGFNKRMLFDGVNDDVTMAGITNEPLYDIEVGFFTPVDITAATTAKALMNFDTSGSTFADIGFGNVTGSISNEVVTLFSTSYRIGVNNITIDAGYHTVRFKWDGVSTYLAYIDGILQTTTASGTPAVVNMPVFQVGGARAYYGFFSGVISNITLRDASGVVTSQWNGYGNTDADWIDQVGSNDGTVNGSPENLLIPRDESDQTNDIFGNPLQYSGSVYPRRPEFRNSYAASFDGVDDYVEFSEMQLSGNDFTIEANIRRNSVASVDNKFIVYALSGGTPVFQLRTGNETGSVGKKLLLQTFSGSYKTAYTDTDVFTDTEWHLVKVTKSGESVVFEVDGSIVASSGSVHSTLATSVDEKVFFGKRSGSAPNYLAGGVSGVSITGLSRELICPLTEGAGDTAHDISGNGNHGTINNASTGTEGAGFWAGRIDGEANALNNNNGFSKRMGFNGATSYADTGRTVDSITSIKISFAIADPTVTAQPLGANANSATRFYLTQAGATIGQPSNTVSLTFLPRVKTTVEMFPTGDVWQDGIFKGNTGGTGSTSINVFIGGRNVNGVASGFCNCIIFDLEIDGVSIDLDSLTQVDVQSVRIPADTSDPTKDVFGDTLTNPAITDGYNGAETELDAYNIAEGDNPSPATNNNSDLDAIEFGTDFASNDAAYMRLKSSTENDRLITFEDDLTGDDKELVEKFTETP